MSPSNLHCQNICSQHVIASCCPRGHQKLQYVVNSPNIIYHLTDNGYNTEEYRCSSTSNLNPQIQMPNNNTYSIAEARLSSATSTTTIIFALLHCHHMLFYILRYRTTTKGSRVSASKVTRLWCQIWNAFLFDIHKCMECNHTCQAYQRSSVWQLIYT